MATSRIGIKTPRYFLEKLQQLPHRGTASPEEKQAANLIAAEYTHMGYQPTIDTFPIIKNGWYIAPIAFTGFAISNLFFYSHQPLPACLFFIGAIAAYFSNLTARSADWLWRFFPGTSQNVYVSVPAQNLEKRTLVILGHYDTARRTIGLRLMGPIGKKTGLMYKADKLPPFFRGPLFITNISVVLTPFLLIIPTPFSSWLLLYNLIVFTVTAGLTLHTALSPFVPGAFDNGSGAATVMATADYFKHHPAKNTRVFFLNDGSEENPTHGFGQFIEKNRFDLKNTWFINLDGVGGDRLLNAVGETNPIGMSVFYNSKGREVVQRVIQTNPAFKSVNDYYLPTPSDAHDISLRGGQVATTLMSLYDNGYIDQYHQMTDTIDKINFKTLNLAMQLVIAIVEEFDK